MKVRNCNKKYLFAYLKGKILVRQLLRSNINNVHKITKK
jgi:hypothetical protein